MTEPRLGEELRLRDVLRHGRAAAVLAWRVAPGLLLGSLLLTAAASAGPIALAWLTRALLDALSTGRPPLTVAGLLALTSLATAATPHALQFCAAELDRRLHLSTQDNLFAALGRHVGLGRLESPSFQDRLQLAGNTGRAAASQIIAGTLGLASSLALSAGFLATLLSLHPAVALLVTAAIAPALWLNFSLSRSGARMLLGTSQAHRRQIFFARLLTSPQAAKEVRLFGLGDFLRRRMLGELTAVNAAERTLDLRKFRMQVLLGGLSAGLAGAGLVWLAAGSGAHGVGRVSLYLLSVAGLQSAIATGVHSLASTHQALLLFDHYAAVTGAEPDLPRADGRPVAVLQHGIRLRDVWFRYGEDQPWILRGLDLSIPAGRSTALVGLNGAGKSTVVKLLCRFYDPVRGSITWDGVDLRDADPAGLRHRISTVFQDFQDYDLSARENVGLGDLDALPDIGRIQQAAELAGIHATLARLPYAYETQLTRIFATGQGSDDPRQGVLLSGGQWQRVALARALLRSEADLLILDEPSSGLDVEAEAELQATLRVHRRGRTSLLISHRLNTLRDADQIVVLDDGRVAEHGGHDELVRLDGIYARLFRVQADGYAGVPG
ncbi:ABC transporter ATP-binding protein [Hamadaea tsunoensis]|uniref:ABC transporter ATP-binding protein n=1 Tax=Hamadaea tsunoensis TaxID=53368 RepID=UPI0003F78CC4|nr:ABC transporter ATP-binding protein [Hamadaea tsunoensis]